MTQIRYAIFGALLLLASSAQVSSADILSLRAEARGGGGSGKGMFGERLDDAFQEGPGKLGYGLLVGAEFFFIDAWIQHDQFLTGSDITRTWTQFMLGMDIVVDLGEQKDFKETRGGAKVGGYSAWFMELGVGLGYGVGTGQQVEPPLNNGQLTDKGFLFEARGLAAYRFSRLLSLGLTVPVSMGYFIKAGPGTYANNRDNHYSAMNASAMLSLRAEWQTL